MYGYIVNYTLQNDESNTFDAGPEEGTLSAPKTGIGPENYCTARCCRFFTSARWIRGILCLCRFSSVTNRAERTPLSPAALASLP